VYSYLKDTNLLKVKAKRAYDLVSPHKRITKEQYLKIAKQLCIDAPFELFTTAQLVSSKRLITALIILGDDLPAAKLEVLDRLVTRCDRSVMAYFELQNELLYLRIPICAAGQGLVQLDKAQRFSLNSRARSGHEAALAYKEVEGSLEKAVAKSLPKLA
jgi:hypothetical protein